MLYRSPRFSALALLRTIAHRIAGAFADFRRTGSDTAYLDGLRPEQLRDLGISRIDERGVRYYR
jgi:uncharacterized protein YjiS (DUF1127 family)